MREFSESLYSLHLTLQTDESEVVQGIQSKQNLILEPSKLFLLMSALRNLSRGRVLFIHEYCNFNRKRKVEPEPNRVATFKRFHFY